MSDSESTPTQTKRKRSAAKSASSDEDEFGEFADAAGSHSSQWPCFIGCSILLSILPAYLFYATYDLYLDENKYLYAIVVPLTAALLARAYHNVYRNKRSRLMNIRATTSHKKSGLSRGEIASVSQDLTNKESLTYALWFNNLVYCIVFCFLAFYALQSLPLPYNYGVSSAIAGFLQWQLSTA
jgi:hypothetical protein